MEERTLFGLSIWAELWFLFTEKGRGTDIGVNIGVLFVFKFYLFTFLKVYVLVIFTPKVGLKLTTLRQSRKLH